MPNHATKQKYCEQIECWFESSFRRYRTTAKILLLNRNINLPTDRSLIYGPDRTLPGQKQTLGDQRQICPLKQVGHRTKQARAQRTYSTHVFLGTMNIFLLQIAYVKYLRICRYRTFAILILMTRIESNLNFNYEFF